MLILFTNSIFSQNFELFEDVENDPEFPAFNEELILNIDGDSIAAYAFVANGEERKETIVLAHGFPGFDNNFDLAHILRRNGYNVIHFNYRGAWGSQGDFMYSNCLEDLNAVIGFITDSLMSRALRIQIDNITILGRSFGGGVGLIAGSQNELVKKIIAVSSANYGTRLQKYKTVEEMGSYQRYMKKQIMINTDIDLFLEELLSNQDEFNVVAYKKFLASKKVLFIEDSDRNDAWINQLETGTFLKIKSNHGFIDKRVEMTKAILSWLYEN